MTDISTDTDLEHNVVELSVSEISQAVKRTLEGAFDHVRVRGEVGRPNYHTSGHLYFTLKDEGAAMDAVCWRGVVGRLNLRLEEGMEVTGVPTLTICNGVVAWKEGELLAKEGDGQYVMRPTYAPFYESLQRRKALAEPKPVNRKS